MPPDILPPEAKIRLLQLDGVVSVGETKRNGVPTVVVGISVTSPELEQEIRSILGNFRVEIKRVGRSTPDVAAPDAAEHGSRVRPVPGGVSVGPLYGPTGSTGFVMTDGSKRYITSNNHVFADLGSNSTGQDIIQPGNVEGGGGDDVVGSMAGYEELQDGKKIDFAWAEPSTEIEQVMHNVGKVTSNIPDVDVGDTLIQSARSGVVRGDVKEVNAFVSVDYDVRTVALFDVITTTKMGIGGDSGSTVALDNGEPYDPVALHFAGNPDESHHIKLRNIEEETGLSVVPSEGVGAGGGIETSRGMILAGSILFGAFAYNSMRK